MPSAPLFLKSIKLKSSFENRAGFPFSLPIFKDFGEIEFESQMTFLVGENGSGKSTLLEAIAAACSLPTAGEHSIDRDETLQHARDLSKHMTFSWTKKTRRGFFLRAEDFFGFSRRIKSTKREMDELADHYDKTATGYGRMLAMGAVLGQKDALKRRYGEDLDANSHGESFLKFFQSRFVPDGLYLMDEPEAPLSPKRQIALLAMLLDMQKRGAQFIVATHSPILMACPGAKILSFDSQPIAEVPYSELEHVFITKSFLDNPERYLKHLQEE